MQKLPGLRCSPFAAQGRSYKGAVVLLENKKAARRPPLLNHDADQNS
ncbi:hypothetical protein [Pseudomonas sp. NMI760_13]|nr:hypothetical protein [Pseudomonas sp. NMI760_13]MCE0912767.1 hypothetical protein [Pseudomonas sp. NMI760_13]MCF1490006.1 hypothetical protein [Pseudomonas sp. AA27]MCP8634237.1 hypothetical protein [Pseudomonas sp. DVZ6]MDD7787146.1 hypothetical protein [Pseudomonas sp. DVZ24]